MMLRKPLCPLADPPNFGEIMPGLCDSESWMTIIEDGAPPACRIAADTHGPVIFINASTIQHDGQSFATNNR